MILDKLTMAEQTAKENIKISIRRISAAKSIKKLLEQIDFSSEVVPLEDEERLSQLMTTLKGKSLDDAEKELIKELINSTNI